VKKFSVTIVRTFTQRLTIEIEAENDLEATDKADDKAGSLDFNDGTSSDADYEVESCKEIKMCGICGNLKTDFHKVKYANDDGIGSMDVCDDCD